MPNSTCCCHGPRAAASCATAVRPFLAEARWPTVTCARSARRRGHRLPRPLPATRCTEVRSLDDELETIAGHWASPTASSPSARSSTASSKALRACGARLGRGRPGQTDCSASPASTRSRTACSWNGSSPLRLRCPTSTSTSSPRATDMYRRVLERFGGERCAVRVDARHLPRAARLRDVGAALGMPPGRSTRSRGLPAPARRDARAALIELPELRSSDSDDSRGGLSTASSPSSGARRAAAPHRAAPCGVLLSDTTLLDRTPVGANWMGFPAQSQFDGTTSRELRAAQARRARHPHAVVDGGAVPRSSASTASHVDLDARCRSTTRRPTRSCARSAPWACFRSSPGQRELIGKFAPETFRRRPRHRHLAVPSRPVGSDMVTPVPAGAAGLERRRSTCTRPAPSLEGLRRRRSHEQVRIVAVLMTGCSLAGPGRCAAALSARRRASGRCAWFYPRHARSGTTS